MDDRGYPPCPNPECTRRLCFMDRRDWDECEECGTPIPNELKLDNDFQPIAR